MNSILAATAGYDSPATAPLAEVPAAVSRLATNVSLLEDHFRAIEQRIESVLLPTSAGKGNSTAPLPPASAVPLAANLHALAERLEQLLNASASVLDRLHV